MKKSKRVSFFKVCQRALQERKVKRQSKNIQFDISYEDSKYLRNIEAKSKKKSYIRLGKKNVKAKKVAIAVVSLVLIFAISGGIAVHTILRKFSKNAKIDHSDLGIEENVDYGDPGVKNIALFGVDTREENSFEGRSDTIMIASINKSAHTVKLVSIMRDSYVPIDGHKSQKITHAYMFGGAQLAIKTINKNFGLNITDYATINFFKLASMIDSLGGIDVEITEKERDYLNSHSMMTPEEAQYFPNPLSSGCVHLTGGQASWYARIRYLDGDDHRTARQRKVIEACLVKLKQIKPKDYVSTVNAMMKFCETSLTPTEILQLAPMVTYNDIKMETFNVPSENINPIGGIYDGAWVWRYDLKKAAKEINAFLYGKLPDYSNNNSWNNYNSGNSNSKNVDSKSVTKKTLPESNRNGQTKKNTADKPKNTEENKSTEKQMEKQTEKLTEKLTAKETTNAFSTKVSDENN